ncbi:hypothetical protein ISG33_05640 [Glaciecola sp. MH2013]|uniref:hypothetical protein n=1 Tax=Glaciecola sp. MH2013 TaxID=2785524 RepID=UPI00189D7712|nr:hypothetical protein [Glaciecola sp. MH2013]MBF7072880.1 hypothetical protein [Glaciecola sp. MH2013]
MHKSIFVVSTLLVLSACGGSSDSSSPSNRPSLPPAVVTDSVGELAPILSQGNISLYGDTSFVTGGSYGFAITTNNSDLITSVNWQQISGPALTVLAPHSQTIGFDTPEAGDYAFRINVTTTSANLSFDHEFSVEANTLPIANVRLDHTVTERAKVSLRVGANGNDISTASVRWSQVAGPQVLEFSQGQTTPSFLTFNLPEVTKDELIQIRAELTFSDGSTSVDDSFITIKNAQISDNAYLPSIGVVASQDMFSFNPNSPYKDAIESCVYNNTLSSTCNFGTLPLLGQVNMTPSVEDILDRTLVSHEWMGLRFKEYLERSVAGPDMLNLLRGVTAVVISYDIRPSFYWTATGAIYLDARNFWVTAEERDTLNEAPDFRSNFGSDLQFGVFWRYVKDNQPYMPGQRFSINARESRSFEVLEADISWLMYHELGHANDFFPPSSWSSLSANQDPRSYFQNNTANSSAMIESFPLTSVQMKALAQVSFAGEDANASQRNYDASDIQNFFEPDISPSYYSYLNEREDYATLFERFMMQYRLGASADIGIINVNNNPNFAVTWGQRDRFNLPSLQGRTRFTVNRVYPELGDVSAIQQEQLPAPVLLRSGVAWNSNFDLSAAENNTLLQSDAALKKDAKQLSDTWYLLEDGHHHKRGPTINHK